jgi:hypothetical protein
VDGLGDETKPGQLVLTPLLRLIIVRGRRTVIVGVVVEVAEGGEEGVLSGLGLLEVLLLERLLVDPPFDLCLEVYSRLSLRLLESYLLEECLFFLGQWATKWSGSPQP